MVMGSSQKLKAESQRSKVVLYGSGVTCRKVLPILGREFYISAIISRSRKTGDTLWGIPLISLSQYIEEYHDCKIILTVNDTNAEEIKADLAAAGITEFFYYYDVIDIDQVDDRERVVSYCMPDQQEDIILYNVFHDFEHIFYIDVGSNDPTLGSITKLLYDVKNANGINIEPLEALIDITMRERRRDKNICVGLGEMDGAVEFFVQGGMSTALEKYICDEYRGEKTIIPVTTLEKICEKYVPADQQITFLKIDVEGYERNVLLGANFQKYRPMVIVMEATLPNTMIPCHDEWEDILLDNRYHHVFSYGVNRYYVADECSELDARFVPMLEILGKYDVYAATIRPIYMQP